MPEDFSRGPLAGRNAQGLGQPEFPEISAEESAENKALMKRPSLTIRAQIGLRDSGSPERP